MQWGAPSGPLNVFRYVVEIVPNVSGEVVDVPVEPHKSLKKGDMLYQIDKRPFQAEVDRLTAAVAEAEQNESLHAQIEEFYNGEEAELWLPALDANSR